MERLRQGQARAAGTAMAFALSFRCSRSRGWGMLEDAPPLLKET